MFGGVTPFGRSKVDGRGKWLVRGCRYACAVIKIHGPRKKKASGVNNAYHDRIACGNLPKMSSYTMTTRRGTL